MKPIIQTARDHAFVASVSIAAFTHSSWSLATVFGGHEPPFGWAWAGWIIPAALIAASIDIGLLSLAAQIKHPTERTAGRVVSFALLALGMFALQGLYVASHMPVIPLAEGVRTDWIPFASIFRDSMLIVVPGLLPLALILHTISGADHVTITQQAVVQVYHDELTKPLTKPNPESTAEAVLDVENWPTKQPTQDYRTMPDLDAAIEGYFDGKPMTEDEMFANSPDTRREVEEERQRARAEGRPMFNNPALADDSRPLGSSPSSNGHHPDDVSIADGN